MAGTKTWADGDALTAADLNGFVRDQWTTICTSGTRPSTSQTGRHIYETDTRRTLVWDGTAWAIVREDQWSTYTPAWTAASANPTLGNGGIGGRWRYTGPKTIDLGVTLTIGSTTTMGSGAWRFGIPTGTVLASAVGIQLGTWATGSGTLTPGTAWFYGNGTYCELVYTGGVVNGTSPHAWANGHQLHIAMRGLELA